MKTICAVIVTFNRLEKLKETIHKSLSEPFSKVIIVNNASTDGTREWLDDLEDKRLKIIHLNKNIGGAGGFHIGFKYVYENIKTDWLVCYDDDAYPIKGSIKYFMELKLNDDVSSVAAAVYHANGTISEMNRPRYNPFWHKKQLIQMFFGKKRAYYLEDKYYFDDKPIEIDASSFVGYFLKVSYIEKFGLPRSELFIYADDLIYTMQARKFATKLIFHPNIRFLHDCNTLDDGLDIYHPLWKVYYSYRNRIELQRISMGVLFYIFIFFQIIGWKKKAKYYGNSKLFLKLLKLAIDDGLKRNFSRNHSEILKISLNGSSDI